MQRLLTRPTLQVSLRHQQAISILNYKNIFKLAFLLISSPAKAWEDISLTWDSQKVIVDYVYPMIGFCGISYFVGALLRNGWSTPNSFQNAMVICCGIALALFGGFFLATYLINLLAERYYNLKAIMTRAYQLVGYAMTPAFILDFVLGLVPSFYLIAGILQLYVFFIVYKGVPALLQIDKKKRLGFTVIAGLLIAGCPQLILFVFNKLTFLFN
jgi:hypothetical protein